MISNIFASSLMLLQSKLECLSLQSFFQDVLCFLSLCSSVQKKVGKDEHSNLFYVSGRRKKCFIILALGGPLARAEPARQGL